MVGKTKLHLTLTLKLNVGQKLNYRYQGFSDYLKSQIIINKKKAYPFLSRPVMTKNKTDYFLPRIASLAALATLNFTTFLAGILMVSPVAGFLPIRAFR